MRPLLLIPLVIAAPLIVVTILGRITGNSSAAMGLGLTLLLLVASWLTGASAAEARSSSRRVSANLIEAKITCSETVP